MRRKEWIGGCQAGQHLHHLPGRTQVQRVTERQQRAGMVPGLPTKRTIAK